MSSPVTSSSHADLAAVSPWVARFTPLINPGGRVLDLACGGGRHARYLAARGHAVEAVDRDAEALARLASVNGICTREADLEGGPWPYAAGMFDAIVVTNYLHRPLFPLISAALAAGGVLLYETFARGNESYGKPSNPAFLLAPGELLAAAGQGGLQVIAYEHGRIEAPKPAVVQRLVAWRAPSAVAVAGPL
jgi:SAM-dependent methyltransferase